MFSNLKIGVRLGLAFAIVLALLATISVISLTRLAELANDTKLITDDRMPKIEMSNDIMENTLIIARSVRNIIISSDKKFEKEHLEVIAKASAANTATLDKLKPMIYSV